MTNCDDTIQWPVIELEHKDNEDTEELLVQEQPARAQRQLQPEKQQQQPLQLDLLTHSHRPESVEGFKCHPWQAERLRDWIKEFTSASRNRDQVGRQESRNGGRNHSDQDDNSSLSDASDTPEVARKCILLTGPPGVGKTSLVYAVARELKMHVIESHASEKRDFKLFSTLKLANQKGKINPIARLFQVAQQKQQVITLDERDTTKKRDHRHSRRKRRKLELTEGGDASPTVNGKTNNNNNQQLSLSGDSSIVLFDDIDVVFEEDGPFLKSLVEFIGESKRPVILTATQSIDYLKAILVHFEHIHLDTPMIEDCVKLLQDVCSCEKYHKLANVRNCRILARKTNCDLRHCLNRIHFYGEQASRDTHDDDAGDIPNVAPDLSRLAESRLFSGTAATTTTTTNSSGQAARSSQQAADEETIVYYGLGARSSPLDCYNATSLVDLMDNTLDIVDRPTLLKRWLNGIPSHRHYEATGGHELGEQIRNSIVELTHQLYGRDLMSKAELQKHQQACDATRDKAQQMYQRINLRIKSRIEPPEKEFFVDMVPMLGETIKFEVERKRQHASSKAAGGRSTPTSSGRPRSPVTGSGTILSRRTRRVQSYLDLIGVYLEPEDFMLITETLLTPTSLGPYDEDESEQLVDLLDRQSQ